MVIFPTLAEFEAAYATGRPVLVHCDHLSDTLTPIAALLALKSLSDYHLLYESVEGGETRARYSIIALKPDILWRSVAGKPQINRRALADADTYEADGEDVFDSLRRLLNDVTCDVPDGLPPMASGLFGFMGYDMVKYMEVLPDENPDTIDMPEAIYMRPTLTLIFDSVKDVVQVVALVQPDERSAQQAYDDAVRSIEMVKKRLAAPVSAQGEAGEVGAFESHVSLEEYKEKVERAKEYIRAGDIFQVVPSRRLSCKFTHDPIALYRALRHLNPSPYMFYLHLGDCALVGSSPEILVRLRDGVVTVRPIAGTRKRGANEAEDKALEHELLGDEKERAEHLMLLDLGRNDVGRVAIGGTVKVTDEFIIERYSHVMHIVSNVEGELADGKDAIDALIAGFPAGTVSGAPKIRAMEIIDELEHERRSFYAGTVGYFSSDGDMDTCITLRTGLVKDGKLYIQAGGGVVADSDPQAEFEETENKAGALMRAAERCSAL